MKQKVDLSDNHLRSPYRVPDGYFSDLNRAIEARVANEYQVQPVGARRYLRLAGFAVGFAAMVMGLTWGFRIITDSMTSDQVSFDESMILSMYDISSEDILLSQDEWAVELDKQQVLDEVIQMQDAVDVDYYLIEEDLY